MNNPEVLIVSGMSGAGRSTAARALEDLGWFVIDNLPPSVLKSALNDVKLQGVATHIAVVVDVRGGKLFANLDKALTEVKNDNWQVRVLYLEASDVSLVRRFEGSRRPHPLQGDGRVLDGLQNERKLLGDLRANADVVIDTSDMSSPGLRTVIEKTFESDVETFQATILSFGFKYGIPVDADFVFDARFLANPFWEEDLKNLTGLDKKVQDFVLHQDGAERFAKTINELINATTPGYVREGKKYVTVAIGCTGGKHRSVTISEKVAQQLLADGAKVRVVHRDLGKE
jgi:RNase adapter protein RapZ